MAEVAGMLEWKCEGPLTQIAYGSSATAAFTHHALTLAEPNRQWEEGVVVGVSISEQAMDLL